MSSVLSSLTDPSLAIIFATSPTGLGHLRVTDALYHGLPRNSSPVLLGAQDPMVSETYRFISINPLTRKMMEILQTRPLDTPLAHIGSRMLRSDTTLLYQQLKTILDERLIQPQTALLIAPHPILGHKLGAIKKQLAKETGVNILLVVQITDDSPQPIWYVYDADLIVVPSHYTKTHLHDFAKRAGLPMAPITVAAYPISPLLTEDMSEHGFHMRMDEVNPTKHTPIHVSVPISGAAVGTSFTAQYINNLHELSDRFVFSIIAREAAFTRSFINTMSNKPHISLYTSIHDRTTVDNYERLFKDYPIALEVTKPSEQAFKALATPKQRGGVILLFSKPVGKQEYDNLHFLRNHGMMPTKHENLRLWQMSEKQESFHDEDLLKKAHHWRAIRLPDDAKMASAFTLWCLQEKLFSNMMHYTRAQDNVELQSNGVEQFWFHTAELLQKHVH
jgi:hypothetical protein